MPPTISDYLDTYVCSGFAAKAICVNYPLHFCDPYSVALHGACYFLDNVRAGYLELDRGKVHSLRRQLSRLAAQQNLPRQEGAQDAASITSRWRRYAGMYSRLRREARQSNSKARYQRYERLVSRGHRESDQTRAYLSSPSPIAAGARERCLASNALSKSSGDR